MSDKKVVLVTGAAGYWGSRVVEALLAGGRFHVMGMDLDQPGREIKGLDFIPADVRNPLLGEMLKAEAVDTVCHLSFVHSTRRSEKAFVSNVLGTSKLLGACAEAGVRKVVLKSSMAVYGARATNSAFLSEGHALRGSRRYGYNRDQVEIETFCNGFFPKAPQTQHTLLRFAGIVGTDADTPMSRFLRDRLAPSLMGFDPMMQIIHADDVEGALVHAVLEDRPGVFNVAAEDAMPLSMMRTLAGKRSLGVFHSFAYWTMGTRGSAHFLPIEPDYLRYPWVGDLTRMRSDLGFEPLYTAEETLREFSERVRLERYLSRPAGAGRADERLHDIIEQRRRVRERHSSLSTGEGEGAAGG